MMSLKLLTATETQYSASLLRSISDQRAAGLFCDVTIVVEDRKFCAHRNILAASSSYFHQLLSRAGQVVELSFVKAEIFEYILNYMYSSELVRIRADRLEELIQAGQSLGVKFVANLGVLLRGLSRVSAGLHEGDKNNMHAKNNLVTLVAGLLRKPIVTEAFSLSAEELEQPVADGGSAPFAVTKLGTRAEEVTSPSTVSHPHSSVVGNASRSAEEEEGGSPGKVTAMRKLEVPSSEKVSSLPQPVPVTSPDNRIRKPLIAPASFIGVRSPTSTPLVVPQANNVSDDTVGVHRKQVTPSWPGNLKLQLSDVKNGASLAEAQPVLSEKKTITLDKASEIDSLSTGCKVYANIGENTYDIVPMKEDPGEGDSKTSRARKAPASPEFRPGSSPLSHHLVSGKKKAKLEQDDHYEMVIDGKTFYVCMVCKRSYRCLTSLRRHYNTHSWEKKYPCHYCDKVFALAEYRTKHEIYHTGERRYQCLLCNEFFINYQLLSSHCKQAHNQDPSGRKEKDDTDNNLYRLLPCKTLQFKPHSYVSDGTPASSEEPIVFPADPGKGPTGDPTANPPSSQTKVTWDDIFTERGGQPKAQGNDPTPPEEFEFVIPETF